MERSRIDPIAERPQIADELLVVERAQFHMDAGLRPRYAPTAGEHQVRPDATTDMDIVAERSVAPPQQCAMLVALGTSCCYSAQFQV